jgi:hypothetical protein
MPQGPGTLYAVAGVVSGLSAAAVAHAVAVMLGAPAAPLLTVIGPAGRPDEAALVAAALLGVLAFSAGVGVLASTALPLAPAVVLATGAAVAVAVWASGGTTGDVLSVVVGTVTWAVVLALLTRLLSRQHHRLDADPARRRLLLAAGAVAAGALVVGMAGEVRGGARRATPATSPPRRPRGGRPFIQGISANGRYFTDQHGDPILVRGDSPWAMFQDLSPDEVGLWCATRERQGFNAAIVSLLGHTVNGAPSDDGSTFDGITPFVNNDITQLNEPYWSRVDDYLRALAGAGITAFLYPSDGWVTREDDELGVLGARSLPELTRYGELVGARLGTHPNIMWVLGGDYMWQWMDSALDAPFDAVRTGIRRTGDGRPWSIQLGWQESRSADNPFWDARVDWEFVYTYFTTYTEVLKAYASRPVRPALFAEGAYEGSAHDGSVSTTPHYLRKMVGWALTSGSPGDFYGCEGVWDFQEGWQDKLSSDSVDHVKVMRDVVEALPGWHDLVPDTAGRLVTGGRGTPVTADESEVFPSGDDYVTAALTHDGSLALIYLPDAATITVSVADMGANPTATWTDPTSGASVRATPGPRVTSPGPNSYGDNDWFLVIRAETRPPRNG